MELVFQCTIPGRPIVKKNTACRGRRGVFYSKRFLGWEKIALLAVHKARGKAKTVEECVHVEYRFYLEDRRGEPDVSNLVEGPQDVIEKVGVIRNDKLVKSFYAEKFIGKEHGAARCEIDVYKF